MGFSLLERRGARYYYRQRVPVDLQPHFGRGELRRSLGTSDHRQARVRVKLEAARAERTFERMRGDAMTNDQLRQIAEEYLNSTLSYCEEIRGQAALLPDSHEAVEAKLHAYSDQFDRYSQALSALDTKQTRKRGLKLAADLVTQVMKERGLTLPQDSDEYAYLTRELLKRALEVLRVEEARLRGDYSNEFDRARLYGSQGGPQVEAKEAPKAGPLLSEVISAYVREHLELKKWTEKTEQENTSILAVFLELIGDRDITKITAKDLRGARSELLKLPSNPKKGKAKEGKSLTDLIAMGLPPMSQSTVSKYLVRLASFFKWSLNHEYVTKNVATGLTIGKPKKRASEARDPYQQADLERLFQALEYDTKQPERFWIPLIGLYSGMRLDEVCQLHLADMVTPDGVHCFSVNEHGDKKVKTAAGVRVVPVHPALIDLGFLEYVKALQAKGAVRLWPNLKKGRDGYSHAFGKWYQGFNRVKIRRNEGDSKKVFHSFRHGVADALKQAGVEEVLAGELLGHDNPNVSYGRYGKSLRPAVLLEMLRKIDFGVDLEILRAKVPTALHPKKTDR